MFRLSLAPVMLSVFAMLALQTSVWPNAAQGEPVALLIPARPADPFVDVLTPAGLWVSVGDTILIEASGYWSVGLGARDADGQPAGRPLE